MLPLCFIWERLSEGLERHPMAVPFVTLWGPPPLRESCVLQKPRFLTPVSILIGSVTPGRLFLSET